MLDDEAREMIEEYTEAGGRIVTALQAELPAVKRLYRQWLDADVPALTGP